MVFYRKYRPKTLAELDNREVAELLGRYLSRVTFPHAFLFTGPKGTGKTSTARILAKSLNCTVGKDKRVACGKCAICTSIADGNNLDILEIDAASNRGIDEIRELRERIKLVPLALKYKVYIIDEVHMLTSEAFNALLKTLEEPPAHAVFILATTESHKVPETIKSRCVRVEFHKATIEETIRSLARIVKGEKLEAEAGVLEVIAKAADGSFRDAAKLLEESALEGRKITLEKVKKNSYNMEAVELALFITLLREKKAKELLLQIQELEKKGKNIKIFFQAILETLKDTLLGTYDKPEKWPRSDLTRALTLFSQAFALLKTAIIPVLPFELAIVEYCEEGTPGAPQVADEPTKTAPKVVTGSTSTVPALESRWSELLEKLKPLNHSIVGVLRSCRPLSLENGTLIIEAAYKFHAERLSDPKVRDIIGSVVKELLGGEVKIETVIRKRT